jgi:tetratricopeptide (TPR) repeat protein
MIELVSLSQAGRYPELERRARELTQRNDRAGLAWKALALALKMQGKDAMPAMHKAAELMPLDAEAQNNLGVALWEAGRLAEAGVCFQRALRAKPNDAVTHCRLGHVLANLGRFRDAAICYQRAATLAPQLLEAHVNLGQLLMSFGQWTEAAASFRHSLQINPQLAPVHSSLGHVLRELKQLPEAIESCQRALQLDPGLVAAHSNLGNALLDLGRMAEAEASYRRALALAPDVAEVHSNLAKLLLDAGRTDESIASAQRAVELAPRLAAAHENLANGLLNVNFEEAIRHYRVALEASPGDAELHNRLGIALRLSGRVDAGEASIRKALELAPDSAAALAALAEVQADRGDFEAAESQFKQALARQPDLSEAWVGISRLRKFSAADADWLEQVQRLADRSNHPREAAALHYALGKYHDDLGAYDAAFASYQRANEIARQHSRAYDGAAVTRQIDELIAAHAQPLVPLADAAATDRAVLIIGMPRSGTSLAEQILSAHPSVFGAGELTYWHSASAALRRQPAADDAAIRAAGEGYGRLLGELSATAARVIDKMPTNFMELGLIERALAGVRILHLQRDPIDTCLSIYFQDFRSTLAYANDLNDLVHFYRQYQRLMDHWRRVVPRDAMLEVPYEALVDDQEGWTRRMLEFIALPWDARCLDFHEAPRSVVTASKWQVRQKINRSSVARWRRYTSHIAPLLALSDEK